MTKLTTNGRNLPKGKYGIRSSARSMGEWQAKSRDCAQLYFHALFLNACFSGVFPPSCMSIVRGPTRHDIVDGKDGIAVEMDEGWERTLVVNERRESKAEGEVESTCCGKEPRCCAKQKQKHRRQQNSLGLRYTPRSTAVRRRTKRAIVQR